MKQSRRARRMERNHGRHKRAPAFNLVSLMDIFTILVFFLLVNSSDGEVLPSTKSVELPESIAEQKPRQNIVVMVTEKDILVQGERVALVADLQRNTAQSGNILKTALETHNKRRLIQTAVNSKKVPEVTIMGSKQIPYQLLKKVMAACTEAGFGKISLAVMQKAAQES
jgi:biopolymer transport protein ExbD